MSRGVQSSAGGGGAGTKAELPLCGTSLPGVFAVLAISPSCVAKRGPTVFSIFTIIENKAIGAISDPETPQALFARLLRSVTSSPGFRVNVSVGTLGPVLAPGSFLGSRKPASQREVGQLANYSTV